MYAVSYEGINALRGTSHTGTPLAHQTWRSRTRSRQSVSYAAMFTQIWQELFGLVTRELVASGQIEDPRFANVFWNGSIPVVWRADRYHHKFE